MSADEILELCNKCARWIAHDEMSAEAAANGAAAHIILKLGDKHPPDYEITHWRIMCREYVKTSYYGEHHTRDARVSMYESEVKRENNDHDDPAEFLDFLDDRGSEREVERIIEYREMKEELEKILDVLPDYQKSLIRLYWAGFSSEECAEIFGVAEKTVVNWASKARKKLRAASPDVGKYTEFLMTYRPRCRKENYFKRARQDETNRYIRQGKRTHAGYPNNSLL